MNTTEHNPAVFVDSFRVALKPLLEREDMLHIQSQYSRTVTLVFAFGKKGPPNPSGFRSGVVEVCTQYGLELRRIPNVLWPISITFSDYVDTLDVYEVFGKGYLKVTHPKRVGETKSPLLFLSFLPSYSEEMQWRRDQVSRVESALSTLRSFEFDAEGKVKRQPGEEDYKDALYDLRQLLWKARLLATP